MTKQTPSGSILTHRKQPAEKLVAT